MKKKKHVVKILLNSKYSVDLFKYILIYNKYKIFIFLKIYLNFNI